MTSPESGRNAEVTSLPWIDIQLQLRIQILDDKKVTVGNIAQFVKSLAIEARLTENMIQSIDEQRMVQYCGERYIRGNGKNRYQRGGTTRNHPVTSVGRLNLVLHKVVDTQNDTIFRPVTEIVEFDGRRVYQEDISVIGMELATKMTYRDTRTEAMLFVKEFPSPRTLNSRVIAYGEILRGMNEAEMKDANIPIAFADGTKSHSQEKGRSKNDINVVLGKDNDGNPRVDVRVNEPWKSTANRLDETQALADDAAIIGDGEIPMQQALVRKDRKYQMDFVHAFRGTSVHLWKDGRLGLKKRKRIVKRIETILYPLKNSVEKHLQDGDREALGRRIDKTVDDLKKIADELTEKGCLLAAEFIRNFSNTIVTFARVALETGRIVPWNSNIIERLMGEISKRIKHKWMRWTTKGLEAILTILLVRYVHEEQYNAFKAQMMRTENLTFIRCESISINAGGEF
jgi:hypothetical protein